MIFILIAILFFLMYFIGGERGTTSFFILCLNAFIMVVSLYLISLGVPPLIVLIISSVLFCLLTIPFQNGWNVKSMASLLSIFIVMILTGLLIYFVCAQAHISGFTEIELQEGDAAYLSAAVPFKMRYLLLIAMIWGQIGAISDTSMAVASALNELHIHNPDFSLKTLFHEGMIIGKDILGTTINTLIFVSMGESIMLFLYYQTFQYTLSGIINSSSFAQMMFPMLLPCIGCILIIPITAGLFSYIVLQKNDADF